MKSLPFHLQVARVLWLLGWPLLIAGVVMLFLGVSPTFRIVMGAGFVLLGINVILARDLSSARPTRSFTARGQVVRGELHSRTGLSDLSIGTCDPDRVAQTRYGPFGTPEFDFRDGIAYLFMNRRAVSVNLSYWRADLAGNILWDLDLRSFIGNLTLDLSALRLENVSVRSMMGRISVNCARRGYPTIDLKTGIGEIEVHVPEGVGARITVTRGRLATFNIENPRLLLVGSGQYTTPDFDQTAAHAEIVIHSAAGDILLT